MANYKPNVNIDNGKEQIRTILDSLLYAVNAYLEDEYEPNATYVNIDNMEYIAFSINSVPFIYDTLDIVFNGMEQIEKRDKWREKT